MKPKWPAITWASCNDESGDGPRVLGINPWIYDFATYNLWSRPAGLLAGLHMLRASGARVALMDCLDRIWSDIPWPKAHDTGKGHYPKTLVPKPAPLSSVPRRYGRYGHEPDVVREAGFGPRAVGAYILFGLPGQDCAGVEHRHGQGQRHSSGARLFYVHPHKPAL